MNFAMIAHLRIFCLALVAQFSSADGEWSISGDCEEPSPVPNAQRTVIDNRVEYICMNNQQTTLYCTNGAYDKYLPVCEFDCGPQPQLSGVSVTNMPGTTLGMVVTFACQSSGVWKYWTGECTEQGWDVPYPICTLNYMLNQGMQRTTSSGDSLYWGQCSSTIYGYHGPWISTQVGWSHDSLRDIKTVIVTLSQYSDNDWSLNFDIVFLRDGTEVDRVNIQRTNSIDDILYEAPTLHLAVSEVRIQAASTYSIQTCDIEVYGQETSAGVCANLVLPFYMKGQTNSDVATLECDSDYGFNYIGGQKEMQCSYNLTWIHTESIGMECSDRPNLAQGISVTQASSSFHYDGMFLTFRDNYDAEVALTSIGTVERLVLEVNGGSSVSNVCVKFKNQQSSGSTTHECQENSDYNYGNYMVFFCDQHPTGDTITFNIQSPSGTGDVFITYAFVLGTPLDSNERLECYQSENGEDYKGIVYFAHNGLVCLYWSIADPSLTDDDLPDDSVSSAANYCRNPRGEQSGPFCVTTEGKSLCPVPKCSDICTMTDHGWDYQGTFRHTRTIERCLFWTHNDIPFIPDWDFPDGGRRAAMNYCRNPGKLQTGPWCYVRSDNDNDIVAELCHAIERCPTTDNAVPGSDSFESIKSTLQHNSVEWFKCHKVTEDSDAPNGLQFKTWGINSLQSSCEEEGVIWMLCVIAWNNHLEWHTYRATCDVSSSSAEASTERFPSTMHPPASTHLDTMVTTIKPDGPSTKIGIQPTISAVDQSQIPVTSDLLISSKISSSAVIEPSQSLSNPDSLSTVRSHNLEHTASLADSIQMWTTNPVQTFQTQFQDFSASEGNSILPSTHIINSDPLSTLTLSTITYDPMSSVGVTNPSGSSSISIVVVSTQSPLEVLTNGTSTPGQCPCRCSTIDANTISLTELEDITEAIKKELHVDKSTLSSSIRSKTSAQDNRPEAVTSGIVMVLFMTSVITLVVISDAVQIISRLRNVFGRFGS